MVDVNDFKASSQGLIRSYEQLRDMDGMCYYRLSTQGSRYNAKLKVVVDMNDSGL